MGPILIIIAVLLIIAKHDKTKKRRKGFRDKSNFVSKLCIFVVYAYRWEHANEKN